MSELAPLVRLEMKNGCVSPAMWEEAGRRGAERLHAECPFVRGARDPGALVYMLFEHSTGVDHLRAAALAGFNARWRELVPGWEPPTYDRPVAV